MVAVSGATGPSYVDSAATKHTWSNRSLPPYSAALRPLLGPIPTLNCCRSSSRCTGFISSSTRAYSDPGTLIFSSTGSHFFLSTSICRHGDDIRVALVIGYGGVFLPFGTGLLFLPCKRHQHFNGSLLFVPLPCKSTEPVRGEDGFRRSPRKSSSLAQQFTFFLFRMQSRHSPSWAPAFIIITLPAVDYPIFVSFHYYNLAATKRITS